MTSYMRSDFLYQHQLTLHPFCFVKIVSVKSEQDVTCLLAFQTGRLRMYLPYLPCTMDFKQHIQIMFCCKVCITSSMGDLKPEMTQSQRFMLIAFSIVESEGKTMNSDSDKCSLQHLVDNVWRKRPEKCIDSILLNQDNALCHASILSSEFLF